MFVTPEVVGQPQKKDGAGVALMARYVGLALVTALLSAVENVEEHEGEEHV